MNPTRTLDIDKKLIDEWMMLKVYIYFGHQINKSDDWLMDDDSKAISSLMTDEELGMHWVVEYLDPLCNQGRGSRGPNLPNLNPMLSHVTKVAYALVLSSIFGLRQHCLCFLNLCYAWHSV